MLTHSTLWPVAPRPFEDEAFGSWFGRLAAKYGINVLELAQCAGVGIDVGEDASTWLGAAVPGAIAVRRLAHLCRMPAAQLSQLRPKPAEGLAKRFYYCYRCLYLNPADVTAPYWKAQWLGESERPCLLHPASTSWVTPGHLKSHPNMRRLLRFISRQRYRAEWFGERRSMYARVVC